MPTGAPLGDEGVGLDPLGLEQFLTGVERAFGAEVRMSLDDCASALAQP